MHFKVERAENIAVADGRPEKEAVPRPPDLTGSGGGRTVALSQLLELLGEEFLGYLPPGHRVGWSDLVAAAAHVAEEIGVSRHAWTEACRLLGRQMAAVALVVVAAKKRRRMIGSPGGYLRALTRRGAKGELYLDRSVVGLLKGDGR